MNKKRSDQLTPKQALFVRYLFEGKNNREAYTLAGYAINCALTTLDADASRLANTAKVKAKLLELRQKAEDKSVMTVLERKQRLTEIARADLSDFVSSGGDITYSKDHANHRAVSEFGISTTYSKKGDPIVTKSIKLQNPITAISELNKMEGIGKEETKVNILNQTIIQNNLTSLSDEELDTLERIVGKTTLIGSNQAGESP
jgi:hypothetical protein